MQNGRSSEADESAEPGPEPEPDLPADHLGSPGEPLHHGPFYWGFVGGFGALTAYWLGTQILEIGSILVLVVVSLFLAAGLNPLVEWFMARGLKRTWSDVGVIAKQALGLGGGA